MSLIVWSLALLHGFFVLIVAEFTHSKTAVILTAIIAAAIGVFTGDPVYIFIDTLCVVAATYYCWTDLGKNNNHSPQEIHAAKEKARIQRIKDQEDAEKFDKLINEIIQGFLALVVIAGFLFFKFWQPSPPQPNTPSAAINPQTVAKPIHTSIKTNAA